MLWTQLLALVPLAYLGTRIGLHLGKRPSPWPWATAFTAALAWTFGVVLGHRLPRYSLIPPVSWSVDITLAPFIMAFLIPLMFSVLVPRLPRQRRAFIVVVTSILTMNYALFPAACPLAVRPALAATTTKIDAHGICLQTTPYTCGPAAAVTCLRVLGIAAHEGPLAIAARTGPVVGTDSRFLARTLNHQFAAHGIRADCHHLTTLENFPTPAIAAMNMPIVGGHFIAVLEVTPVHVLVGDPYSGRARLSHKDFLHAWTGITIPLSRSNPPTSRHSPRRGNGRTRGSECAPTRNLI